MFKHHNLKKVLEDFDVILLLMIPLVFMMIYVFLLRVINFSKQQLKYFTMTYFFVSIMSGAAMVSILSLGNIREESYLYGFFMIFLYCFGMPLIEPYFVKAWVNDKEAYLRLVNPINASHVIEYHDSPHQVRVIGFLSRYSLLSSFFFLAISGLITLFFKLDPRIPPLSWGYYLTALFFAIFSICLGFIRLTVRCPNCKLLIYHYDDHLNAYFDTAKHAVKDKIIECPHCYAAYILDPKMDFEYAKKRAKEISAQRQKIKEALTKYSSGR